RAHYLKTVLRAELSQEQEEILRRYEQEIISQRILPQAPPSNDNCGGAIPLQLNIPVTSTTLDAVNDYQLPSGTTCFSAGGAIGSAANTATGRDVVYSFTAPDNDTYSFRVTSPGVSLDRTLFLSSSCPTGAPPITIADAQCIRAANRRSSSDRAEEIHCVPLLAGQTVYLFIDDTFTSPTTGQPFTVEVIRCRQETESNDTPPSANAFSCGISGRIQPNTEADFISLGTHPTNSRLFAIVDGGQSSPATTNPDYDLRVTTSTDTLEYDQNNNIIEFGSESPSIAGTPLPNVPVYLRISASHSVSVEPYRVYIAVRPPSSSAIPEIEPNNSIAQANSHSSNYFTGVIQNTSDVDIFAFNATVGTQLFLSASADPDRDNTPFNIRLELLNSSGNVLLDAQDAEATSNTTPGTGSLTSFTPNFPGESILWRAQYTGTYYARVRRSGGTVPNNYLLSIAVTNCGISCSTFPVSPGSLPGGMVGMPYSQTISAGSPGTSPFVYYVTSGSLPPGLTLSTLNSVATLSGTPTTAGTYNFTITAADVNNCQSSQTYTVTITGCPTITLSPTTLPNGTVGTPYSQSVSASGGNAPYTFSSSGTLPPGITLNTSTGAISGIPTAAGSYTFTITATDVFGCTGSRTYTVTVACPTITITPTTLPPFTVGVSYSQTLTASGGTAPYTFTLSSGSLPPGISLSPSGTISGIATAAGSYTFTVTATDVYGCTGSITLTLSNGLEHLAIYVADTNNHRIQRTTDDGATWQVVADGFGATAGKFNKPQSVSADSTGNVIFVADTGNNRIQRSTDGGSNWEIISAGPGVCAGCFNSPQGVAYDEANNKLYISDTNNHRIQVLSNAATVAATSAVSSWTIMSGTGFGTVIGKFNQPSGIAVDASGKVYVADTNNHRIQAYDGNNWSVFAGTSFGAAPGKLNTPRGIYVDTQGRVWIADTENSRVQVWNSGTWSVFMPLGATAGSVNKPEGLAVAASGNLFVSDATHRIQKKPTAGGAATIVGTFGASPGSFHLPGGIR
ncbi:MAG: putative Ig domain-containing protein, partial [Blastocatellia bacterium]|nr:putative Ig domain-containing protein [Blastocatellia bacterium]